MANWTKPCLKLVSDGTGMGTRLLMPDGTPVPNITRIEMRPITADGAVEILVTCFNVELDVDVESPLVDEFAKPSA